MIRFINYLLALPLCGFGGTTYFGQRVDRSNAVADIGYDSWNRTLDVHFVRGRSMYRYFDVNIWTVIRLVTARSLGIALNDYVRNAPATRYLNLTWRSTRDFNRLRQRAATRMMEGSGRQKVKMRKRLNKLMGWS